MFKSLQGSKQNQLFVVWTGLLKLRDEKNIFILSKRLLIKIRTESCRQIFTLGSLVPETDTTVWM